MKKVSLVVMLACSVFLVWCGGTGAGDEWSKNVDAAPTEENNVEAWGDDVDANNVDNDAEVIAWNVEIMLADRLDGILSEYCLDIAGGNQNVDPANGLQAHTCYSYQGDLGDDQVFDAGKLADNSLSMPIYDVCVSIASLEAGAEVSLTSCDGDATPISFSGDWTISPVASPDLCFTASEESRMGKWSEHQIRDLTLEACDENAAAYQSWKTRSI